MKFVAGKDGDTTATLVALSVDKGHTGTFDVRATTRDGYMVHDDVYAAYADGAKGTLSVTHTVDGGNPLRVTFDCTPWNIKTSWNFGDGTTAEQADGHTVHYYATAGSYTVKVDSPGRTQATRQVVLTLAERSTEKQRSSRRKSDREARDGD